MSNNKTVFGTPLLDVRLWLHLIAFVHLFITAIVTLSIDPTVDDDPRVRVYINVRWKLLTCWFNIITLAYLPLCVYCEFKVKQGFGDAEHVQRIRYVTDVTMTGILFPVTMYGDVIFWLLMNINSALIAPPKLFSYLPYWCQHSLHSVSMAVVVLDVLLTPRTRPKSLMPRFLLSMCFAATYTLMVYISCLMGENVYNIFEYFSNFQTIMFLSLSYIIYIGFYFVQWKIIEFVWEDPKALKEKL